MTDPEVRTEYMVEALIVARHRPESDARWEDWGGPWESLDTGLGWHRLRFVRELKERAHSGGTQAPMRVLDYRVMARTITTSPWVEVAH